MRTEALPPVTGGPRGPEGSRAPAPSCWVTAPGRTAQADTGQGQRRPATVWPGLLGPHANIPDPAETSTFPGLQLTLATQRGSVTAAQWKVPFWEILSL